MKLKFSKTLAIACVLCMTFATLTAFAGVTVTTITNYDYDAADDAEMVIETTIAGLDNDGEITYYVADEDGDIVYIDQATATGATANFKFAASRSAVLAATAKNGSDKGYAFPTFEFNDGCNYLTEGTATVTEVQASAAQQTDGTYTYTYQGKISGEATAYGVTITLDDGTTQNLLAMGCDKDGTFVIQIENLSETEATAEKIVAYAATYTE